jgi:uncharacterized protein YacL
MTPQLTVNLLRVLFVVFTAYVGTMVGGSLPINAATGAAGGAAFGLAIVLADRLLKGVSLRLFSAATFGLLVGTLAARLFLASNVLLNTPEEVQWVTSLAVYAAFGYLGMMLAIRSNRDELALIIPYVRFRRSREQQDPVIVDSNIILDGRLGGICATGFLSSSIVVPRFVLEELQRLADSADPLKRERGRLALERLQKMQSSPSIQVSVHDSEGEDGALSTDTRLVQLGRLLNAPIVTNDSNLCALARLQGVQALNFNELALAVRPALSAGDQLDLTLSKEGREPHQALGYLNDGTMIVVNNAREHLYKTVPIVISGVVQTNAGRLLFAELRQP